MTETTGLFNRRMEKVNWIEESRIPTEPLRKCARWFCSNFYPWFNIWQGFAMPANWQI